MLLRPPINKGSIIGYPAPPYPVLLRDGSLIDAKPLLNHFMFIFPRGDSGAGQQLCGACVPAAGPCSVRDGGAGATARQATPRHSSGSRADVPCSQHYCLPNAQGPGQRARPKNSGNRKKQHPSRLTACPTRVHPCGTTSMGMQQQGAEQSRRSAGRGLQCWEGTEDPGDPPVPRPSPGRACWFQ